MTTPTKKAAPRQENSLNPTHSNYTISRDAVEAAKQETKSKQAHRLVDYLLAYPDAITGQICHECAIGNLSAAAAYIKPALQKRGLTIVSVLPETRIANRFGEPSMSHRWRLQALC